MRSFADHQAARRIAGLLAERDTVAAAVSGREAASLSRCRELRRAVGEPPELACEHCRLPQDASALRFHVQHVIARQRGGSDDAANLALACPECNYQKGTNLILFLQYNRNNILVRVCGV